VKRKPPPATLVNTCDDVEAQFYEALQQGDIERLMAAWADDDDIVCVHPGGPRLVGPLAIRAAFEGIFSNGVIPVTPKHVRRIESDSCVVHNVLERVQIPGSDAEQVAWVIATNVYVKTVQGWRLVAHHASPGTGREPEDVADAPSTLH
jgi:uncharacterized protein (TIGR02246 family)